MGIPVAGYGYSSNTDKVRGTMTGAGVALMAICKNGLEMQGKLKGDDRKKIEEGLEAGFNWLVDHYSVTSSEGGGPYYYYMYGLERMGALLNRGYLGEHPWYLEGAKELIKRQKAGGDWGGEDDTCFAVLFLRRATRVVTTGSDLGLVGGAGTKRYECAGDSEVHLIAAGNSPMDVWISGFHTKAAAAYAKDGGLKIEKVEYLVDGKVAETVRGKPNKAWEPKDHYKTQLEFSARGKYKVSARVTFDTAQGAVTAEAKGVQVDVSGIYEEWMDHAARHRRENLVWGKPVTAKTSTADTYKEGDSTKTREGKLAADGLQVTYWSTKADDKAPSLTLEWKEAVPARVLSLSQLNRRLPDAGSFDRITKVQVIVNEMPAQDHALEADDLKPTYIQFSKTAVPVKKVQIKILERAAGKQKGKAGFTEIGLEDKLEAPKESK
jgi:hypothetical protein